MSIFLIFFSFLSKAQRGSSTFRTQVPADWAFLNKTSSYSDALSETRKAETKRRFLKTQYDRTLFQVIQKEEEMGLSRRWTPLDPEYIEAAQRMNEKKYRDTLEKLHGLVIQRLWELHKMNLSGTGAFVTP